jgi:hypothetical protein
VDSVWSTEQTAAMVAEQRRREKPHAATNVWVETQQVHGPA